MFRQVVTICAATCFVTVVCAGAAIIAPDAAGKAPSVNVRTSFHDSVITHLLDDEDGDTTVISSVPVTVSYGNPGTDDVRAADANAGSGSVEVDDDLPSAANGSVREPTTGKWIEPAQGSAYQTMIKAGFDQDAAALMAASIDNSGPQADTSRPVTPKLTLSRYNAMPTSPGTGAAQTRPTASPNDRAADYPIYTYRCTDDRSLDDGLMKLEGCTTYYLIRKFSNGDWQLETRQQLIGWSLDSAIFNPDNLTGLRARDLEGPSPNQIVARDPGSHQTGPCTTQSTSVTDGRGGFETTISESHRVCQGKLFADGDYSYPNELASHWSALDGGANGSDDPRMDFGVDWWDNPPGAAPGPFKHWYHVWWD